MWVRASKRLNSTKIKLYVIKCGWMYWKSWNQSQKYKSYTIYRLYAEVQNGKRIKCVRRTNDVYPGNIHSIQPWKSTRLNFSNTYDNGIRAMNSSESHWKENSIPIDKVWHSSEFFASIPSYMRYLWNFLVPTLPLSTHQKLLTITICCAQWCIDSHENLLGYSTAL